MNVVFLVLVRPCESLKLIASGPKNNLLFITSKIDQQNNGTAKTIASSDYASIFLVTTRLLFDNPFLISPSICPVKIFTIVSQSIPPVTTPYVAWQYICHVCDHWRVVPSSIYSFALRSNVNYHLPSIFSNSPSIECNLSFFSCLQTTVLLRSLHPVAIHLHNVTINPSIHH